MIPSSSLGGDANFKGNNMVFETYDKWATVIVSTILIVAVFFAVLEKPSICIERVKVVDIVSAQGRSVDVLLDNGTVKNVNQPTKIMDGSDMCIKWDK